MRPFRTSLLLVSTLLAATGCSRSGGGGGLQADVASHCAELQRDVENLARAFSGGRNLYVPLGGPINSDMLTRVYRESAWCARVRSEGQRELMGLMQEMSVLADEVVSKLPLATKGKSVAEGWSAPEESAVRAEVSTRLDRIAVILGEINKRPLKH